MPKKIDNKIKEAIAQELRENPRANRTFLAGKYSVSRGMVYEVAKKVDAILAPGDIDFEAKIHAQKVQVDTYKSMYRASLKRVADIQAELDVFKQFQEVKNLIVPQNYKVAPYKGSKQAIPILKISDWHIDEEVDPNTVCDLNNFNLEEAQIRVAKLAKFAVKIIGMLKRESNIDTLLITALGDFMSGWIHDELMVSSKLTPIESMLEILNMLTGLFQNILDAKLVKKIVVVFCVGNHSRITKKPFHKMRVKTSYEWMIYNLVMQYFQAKGEKRIVFQIPSGYFNWIEVCGRKIRCHHGDNIRYNGGVNGVQVPVNKAINEWNKGIKADLDIFGHWHTLKWDQNFVINGSLIGWNTFAEKLKCPFEKAQQSISLMHSRFGLTGKYPIVVQD